MPYADKEEQKAYQRKWGKQRRDRIAEFKKGPCTDCGKKFPPCVMDFDHVNGEKDLGLSSMSISRSWNAVLAEIKKCELVCANCHRVRTYKRQL